MKITHNKVGQNLNIRDTAKLDSSKVDTASGAQKVKDNLSINPTNQSGLGESQVEFSSRAHQFNKAKEAALNAPSLNQEKIERLKQQIKEGTYKVDAEAIAERMLNDHLLLQPRQE